MAILALTGRPAAHDPITTTVTFSREIRAILSTRCATCHSRGGPAPMPLATYDEVRPWARAIKAQVLERRMPIWHAAHGYGAFANDPSLTPAEMSAIASWVNGGMPRGSTPSSPSLPVASAFRRNSLIVRVPAREDRATSRGPSIWIAGWTFEPGDPLVTRASFRSDGGPIGVWVAGDPAVVLPRGIAIRAWGRIEISVQRRQPADYEQPFTARQSVLRLAVSTATRLRRAWTEAAACGAPRSGRDAQVLAITPRLAKGADARIWIEGAGAPRTIVGWFRSFDPAFARTYWLSRAAAFDVNARLAGDSSCEADLLLVRP